MRELLQMSNIKLRTRAVSNYPNSGQARKYMRRFILTKRLIEENIPENSKNLLGDEQKD